MNNTQNQTIDFKVNRDFGQVFNITFVFLKQNLKPLLTAILSFALPFALLHGIVQAYIQMDLYSFLDMNPYNMQRSMSNLFTYYLIIIALTSISYTMMFVTVYSYICLYIEKGGMNFTTSDVWNKIKSNILKTFGSFVLLLLMIVFASSIFFFLLGIPGLYLWVSTCFVFIVLIYEKKGFGQALSRSFQLTHKRWWWTLLLLIVVFMIVWLVGMVFNIPNMVISFSAGFNQLPSESMQYTQMVLTIVTTIIGVILQTIPLVAVAFHYFSIVEEHEGKGLEQRINSIGQD